MKDGGSGGTEQPLNLGQTPTLGHRGPQIETRLQLRYMRTHCKWEIVNALREAVAPQPPCAYPIRYRRSGCIRNSACATFVVLAATTPGSTALILAISRCDVDNCRVRR